MGELNCNYSDLLENMEETTTMDIRGVRVNSSNSIGEVDGNLCDKGGLSERVRRTLFMYIGVVRVNSSYVHRRG